MEKTKTIIIMAGAFLFLSLLGPRISQAVTYWAAPNGSDSNSCASVSGNSDPKRYRTIGGVWSCLSAGDTAKLKTGTYNYTATNPKIPSGNSTAARTKIVCEAITSPPSCSLRPSGTAQSGSIILFNGTTRNHLEFDGILFDARNVTRPYAAFRTSGGAHRDIWIRNCEARADGKIAGNTAAAFHFGTTFNDGGIVNCHIHHWTSNESSPGVHGVYVRAKRNLIERSYFHDFNGLCTQFYSGAGGVDDNVWRFNTCHSAAKSGIYCGSGSRNKCYGNLIYNTNIGVAIVGTNNEVYNNTIYNTKSYCISDKGGNAKIRNNILRACGSRAIYNTGAAATASHNLTSDPLFVDAARGNFRLKTGSPAIDTGTAISIVTTDLDGRARPQGKGHDIGAYEYTKQSSNQDAALLPSAPTNLRASSK